MVTIDSETFVLLYVSAGLILIFGLWFYYDVRDRNLYEMERFPVIFHCLKCSTLYTAGKGSEVWDCPKCGFTNERLKF